MKAKIKKYSNSLLALFLVSLLIVSAGVAAFISAHEKQDNMFTLGNISMRLYEDNWYDHNTGELLHVTDVWTDENDVQQVGNGYHDPAEYVIPGQEISQDPYIENNSISGVWAYMSVGIPVKPIADVLKTETEFATLRGSAINLKITGYAFQQGIVSGNNLKDMWDVYSNGNSAFSNLRTDNYKVEVMKVLDYHTNDWELVGTYKMNDDYNYYVYGYKHLLHGSEEEGATQPEGQERPYYRTPSLFTKVTVCGYGTKAYTSPALNYNKNWLCPI